MDRQKRAAQKAEVSARTRGNCNSKLGGGKERRGGERRRRRRRGRGRGRGRGGQCDVFFLIVSHIAVRRAEDVLHMKERAIDIVKEGLQDDKRVIQMKRDLLILQRSQMRTGTFLSLFPYLILLFSSLVVALTPLTISSIPRMHAY